MPGHRWDSYAGSDWVPSHGYGEEERCERCGMIRRAIIDIRGAKSNWMYERPMGYQTDLTTEELRLLVIRQRKNKRRALKLA